MESLSPSAASRVAAACPLGLVACMFLALAAWYSTTEELESLAPPVIGIVFGFPIALWLVILAAFLAGRRTRVLGPARVSGAVLGILGLLTSFMSVGGPAWGTLACAGLAIFGGVLYALAGRPDVAESFVASDARARSRGLTTPQAVGRHVLTGLAAILAGLLLLWMGGVLFAFYGDSGPSYPTEEAWTGAPATAVPPTALDAVGVSAPSTPRILQILAAEGYRQEDIHVVSDGVVAFPITNPNPSLYPVNIHQGDARSLAYWRTQAGTTTGQYAFTTGAGCRFIAEPVPGLILRVDGPRACAPFGHPHWDPARRIARGLAGG